MVGNFKVIIIGGGLAGTYLRMASSYEISMLSCTRKMREVQNVRAIRFESGLPRWLG
jgi:anaerobic glycerol-3-phosphate dehydrogenase